MNFTRPLATDKRPGQFAALVSRVADSFFQSLGRNDIELRLDIDESTPTFSFDSDKIHQTLINLTKNAVEAMPNGGVLSICSGHDESIVWLEVRDTGDGIPEHELSAVFEPFFSRKKEGSGIGLAVCRAIIEDHGGQILAFNRPEGGMTFRIELPIE